MTEYFRNRYRVPSNRMPEWDYSIEGHYFVTICTFNKINFFGVICDQEMKLNATGSIALNCWKEIPNHNPSVSNNVFIVMPNHIHGIIEIKKNEDSIDETPRLDVSTGTPKVKNWKTKSLGVIINQYKRAVTISARKINPNFEWQTRFHDHIIRNQSAYNKIEDYIKENPLNWPNDKHFNQHP